MKKENKIKSSKKLFLTLSVVVSLLLILFFIFNPFADGIKGVSYQLNDDGVSYTISKDMGLFPKKLPTIIHIPETYKGKPITRLKSFLCSHHVEKVYGSNTLEYMESNSFACRDLTSLNFSKNTMHLKEVIFPIYGNLKTIGAYSFYQSISLEKIVLPQNFSYFGRGVFYQCINLKEIIIYNKIPPD